MAPTSHKSLTPLALAALEVLHERPRHPYEIHQTMRDRHMHRLVKLSAGTLYHTIERLDRDGLIEVVETSREGRRPERTIYRLTQAGRDAFAERLRHMLSTVADEHPEVVMAVEFLHVLGRTDALLQLHNRMTALESAIAAADVYCRRLAEDGLHPLHWPSLPFKRAMWAAELAWIRDLVGQLERGDMTWPTGEPRPTELRLVSDEHDDEHNDGHDRGTTPNEGAAG